MNILVGAMAVVASLGWAAVAAADGHAQSWTLDGANSKIAFGSVKKDTVGEIHTFDGLSGTVAANGTVDIEIELASVDTLIDIRNERIIEHVFKGTPTATLTAEFDMDDVVGLDVGETGVIDVEGVLSLVGTNVDVETEMFVARLSETRVLVTTSDMVMLSTADAGLTAGIDKLMELADLPGITRVAPVTMRLIFDANEQKAEAASAAPATQLQQVAVLGDADAGKKVFRKCMACHSLKEGKNGAGPSLYGIFNASAAQVEGFKYSKAMRESGVVWTAETLAAFAAAPRTFVKGTRMAFAGLKKEEDITNLIAYLAEETAN